MSDYNQESESIAEWGANAPASYDRLLDRRRVQKCIDVLDRCKCQIPQQVISTDEAAIALLKNKK
jgi:hypothetical protein